MFILISSRTADCKKILYLFSYSLLLISDGLTKYSAQKLLEKKNIKISRSIVGNYTTSLEMAGGSFTITKLDENIIKHWDSPVHTSSLRWKM